MPRCLSFVPLVAAGLVAVPALAGSVPPGSEIDVLRSDSGRLVVTAAVAGEPLRWEFDTGAAVTMIAARHARRWGVEPREVWSATDTAGRSLDVLAGGPLVLALGELRVELGEVGWYSDREPEFEREGLAGVLGADALAQIDLALDLEGRRARVAPSGALGAWYEGVRETVEPIDGRPALRVDLADLGQRPVSARFVLDSGADRMVIFGHLAERVASRRARFLREGELTGVHGSRRVAFAPPGRAAAGGVALRVSLAALLPDTTWRDEDGLLPAAALGPLLLQLGEGRVVLDARLRDLPRPSLGAPPEPISARTAAGNWP